MTAPYYYPYSTTFLLAKMQGGIRTAFVWLVTGTTIAFTLAIIASFIFPRTA